jgi:membrane protein required for colicin V production
MQSYDLIMLVVLVGATLLGAWKGMAWQLASMASIVVSYFVAVNLRGPVSKLISAEPPWNMFLAMLLLYLGTSMVIWLAFQIVRKAIERMRLKEFDHQVGGMIGFVKGIVLCVIITMFAVTLMNEERRQDIINSRSGYYIAMLLDKAHGVMPEEVHDVLHPYLNKLNDKLEHRYDSNHFSHDGEEEQEEGIDATAVLEKFMRR